MNLIGNVTLHALMMPLFLVQFDSDFVQGLVQTIRVHIQYSQRDRNVFLSELTSTISTITITTTTIIIIIIIGTVWLLKITMFLCCYVLCIMTSFLCFIYCVSD